MQRELLNTVRHDAAPREQVLEAARAWEAGLREKFPEIMRVGCFGSYARDTYAPGSDLDILIEVTATPHARRADRAARYLPDTFPVPIELFVYTTDELRRLRREGSAFIGAVDRDVCWIGS